MVEGRWNLHFCFLDARRWGSLGCSVYEHTGNRDARVELHTPLFHLGVALLPSGRYVRIADYHQGMSIEEIRTKTQLDWWHFKRRLNKS